MVARRVHHFFVDRPGNDCSGLAIHGQFDGLLDIFNDRLA
jgi:hypothetical protein